MARRSARTPVVSCNHAPRHCKHFQPLEPRRVLHGRLPYRLRRLQCESEDGGGEVRSLGREEERWRFYRGEGPRVAPRAAALDTSQVFDEVGTVRPPHVGQSEEVLELNPAFPEVPADVLRGDRWHLLWNAPFQRKGPIHVLEGRSILGALKHVSRDANAHGKRRVILNDNMGVVLAMSKGRCSNYLLLRLIRRVSALSLATGIKVCLCCTPSEYNAADSGSRAWEPWTDGNDGVKAGRPEEDRGRLQQGGSTGSKQNAEEPAFERGARDLDNPPNNFADERVVRREAGGSRAQSKLEDRCQEAAESSRDSSRETEEAWMSETTRKHYGNKLSAFFEFAAFNMLEVGSEASLDIALLEYYCDSLYLDGEDANYGHEAPEFERPEEASAAPFQAGVERVVQDGARPDLAPDDRSLERGSERSHTALRLQGDGSFQRGDFFDLREARRALEVTRYWFWRRSRGARPARPVCATEC